MNQEIKEKWLKALKSGEYNYCSGSLKKNDCFCALGVLCDLLQPNKWLENGAILDITYFKHADPMRHWEYLPSSVSDKAELNQDQIKAVVNANDNFYSEERNYLRVIELIETF